MSTRRLLITDLDNTVWDWFSAWHSSFSSMLAVLSELSGVEQGQLEDEIRTIHQLRRTTEYSNLIDEIPSVIAAAGGAKPSTLYDKALHVLNSKRKSATKLYPEVLSTLQTLKESGVRIVAFTESVAFWTEWRIKRTSLDGVIDVLYSAPDHDLPRGMTVHDLRTGHLSAEEYGLRSTVHRHTPPGVTKPSADVLRAILANEDCNPQDAVYIGDSKMKDVAMAQDVGVLDYYARYGVAGDGEDYELLRRVTHWSDEEVERERQLALNSDAVVPTRVCNNSFAEVLEGFQAVA